MRWHADAPNRACNCLLQGHAVADNISGPCAFVDAYSPLGNWPQDFGLFTDTETKRSKQSSILVKQHRKHNQTVVQGQRVVTVLQTRLARVAPEGTVD